MPPKGPSIKYVHTEGGGGSKNLPILRTNSTGNADEGGGGGESKILRILRTYLTGGCWKIVLLHFGKYAVFLYGTNLQNWGIMDMFKKRHNSV